MGAPCTGHRPRHRPRLLRGQEERCDAVGRERRALLPNLACVVLICSPNTARATQWDVSAAP
eukprot:5183534-Prymnesium_polylepis.2